MSASRMVYLIVIPAMISMLVPVLAAAYPELATSQSSLNIAVSAIVLFIAAYGAGAAWLALRDHRRISDKIASPRR